MTYLPLIQFQDQVYQIKATEGTQAIIPPKFIGEIKGLPEDTLSATEAVADVGCQTHLCTSHLLILIIIGSSNQVHQFHTGTQWRYAIASC